MPLQEKLKRDLHDELRIKYREFFESRLAIDLLQHPEHFTSVRKISTAITQLINSNVAAVTQVISENPKIVAELREPYFGSCYQNLDQVSSSEALDKILSILNDDNAELASVMQIHCIFIYRIYDQLDKKIDKTALINTLFPDVLFSKENRPQREENKKSISLTDQLGVSRHPVFTKMLAKASKKHLSAKEKYIPDCRSAFFKSALEKQIPVICGASGHSGSLLLGSQLYGNLNPEELKEYACAIFAFLAAGGNHTFHEVMIVATLLGVDFQAGNYSESISSSIRGTEAYRSLSKHFPEFLDTDKSSSSLSILP